MKLSIEQIVKKYNSTANQISHCWLHRAIKQNKLPATLEQIEGQDNHHWMIDEATFLQWRKNAIARKANSQFVIICDDEQEMNQFAEFKKLHKLPVKLAGTKVS